MKPPRDYDATSDRRHDDEWFDCEPDNMMPADGVVILIFIACIVVTFAIGMMIQ